MANSVRASRLTWDEVVLRSPYPVEQDEFPKWNSGHRLPAGGHPCTDGALIYIPRSYPASLRIQCFAHELGHALLHYPNGYDPDLTDDDPPHASKLEYEASLFGNALLKHFGVPDEVNKPYLDLYPAGAGRADHDAVNAAVAAAIQVFS